MLDAHQLNIFLVAAETLNFTRAAGLLHMSQPSVSQHIQGLEQHFGEDLFIRQGRTLHLTDAGETLLPLARKFVRQSTCIDEAMASFQGTIQGTINICCCSETGIYLLPSVIESFHSRHPEITIHCNLDCSTSPLERLLTGDIHFLITNRDQVPNPCLEYQQLLEDDICLIVHPRHPLAARESVKISEISDETFVLHQEDSLTHRIINQALNFEEFNLLSVKSRLSVSSTEGVVLAVARGLGIGFSSRLIAEQVQNVQIIEIEDVKITQNLSIVRNLSFPSSTARETFWSYLVNTKL